MKRILLIEDEGSISKKISEKLRNKRYIVKCAYSYASAIGLWEEAEENNEEFDCIILDLNINPNGLTDEDVDKYFPIHGIQVLNEICNKKDTEGNEKYSKELKKDIWNKTIVYSAYIYRLKEMQSDFEYFSLLELVSKQQNTSISDLLEIVNKKLDDKK